VKKILLGSVSSQIVSQTDIPTIVIKEQSQGNRSIDADLNAKGARTFRLALASDGSEAAARACEYLVKNLQGATCIKVFSSVTKNRFFQSEPLSQVRYWESVKATIRGNLTTQTLPLKAKTSQFSIDVEESTESPAHAIEGFVQVEKIDMIAFGKTGRSAFKRVFLGSVATHLASQLPCHALVVP
jgi:nucleotide-binding universal stress UspA family protein